MEALIAEDAWNDIAAVITFPGGFQEVDPTACGSRFRIRAAENDLARAAVDDGSGAHRTGFFGDVKRALFQPPIAESFLSRGQCEHFGVGRGVAQCFDLIPGAGNDSPFFHDDRSDRNFFGCISLVSLAQGLAHEINVAVQINNRCFLVHA